MKNTFIAISIPLVLSILFNLPGCYNDAPKAQRPDQDIRIETRHVPNARCPLLDYQLELHDDTVFIYDNGRFVDRYITDWKGHIDSIFMKDNQ